MLQTKYFSKKPDSHALLHMDSYHPIHLFSSKKFQKLYVLGALALLKQILVLLVRFCYLI